MMEMASEQPNTILRYLVDGGGKSCSFLSDCRKFGKANKWKQWTACVEKVQLKGFRKQFQFAFYLPASGVGTKVYPFKDGKMVKSGYLNIFFFESCGKWSPPVGN